MDISALPRASTGPRCSRNVTFQQERIADWYSEACDLLIRHHDEVGPDLRLDPDVKAYLHHETNGNVVLLTARVGRTLVGYIVYRVTMSLHHKVLEAQDDIHYVLPAYRNSGIGLKLLKFGEQEMKRRGVKIISGVVSTKHDHGAIFEYLGYDKTEIVYTKRL